MPIRLRVRELRTARGWSQRELAERAGVRHATINAIEAARTSGVDFDVLERLANTLEVGAGYLIVQYDASRGAQRRRTGTARKERGHLVATPSQR